MQEARREQLENQAAARMKRKAAETKQVGCIVQAAQVLRNITCAAGTVSLIQCGRCHCGNQSVSMSSFASTQQDA